MKSIGRLLAPLIFLSCVMLSWYFLFHNPFAFTFEFNNYGQYVTAFVGVCCWLVFLILLFNKRLNFEQDAVLIIGAVCIGCLLFSRYYSFANEYFTNITVVILLYAMLLSAGIGVLHSLLIFFAATFFWQLYIAFNQMHGFYLDIQTLNIRGTLQNSGIFSWYIVSQLPFLHYLFFSMPVPVKRMPQPAIPKQAMFFLKSVKIIVFAVIVAFIVLIIWRAQSRIAMIALGMLLLSFFILYYGKAATIVICRLPKSLVFPGVGAVVAGLAYSGWYLFNLKKLSAITRVMTLDIAKDHFTDHGWLGTGIGRFSWYYPQWQAQYFATHPAPSMDYFLSAGESYYLFNEFIELFYTTGLPGLLVFIFLLIRFFTVRSVKYRGLLNAAKLTVIALLVCGCSSYPFHVNFLLLLLVFCFATATIVNENKKAVFQISRIPGKLRNTVVRICPIVLIVIAGVGVYAAFGQWQAKKQWDQLRNRLDGSRAEIVADYGRLFKPLHQDGKFLTDYGMTLLEDSTDCSKATAILEEAKKYFISKVTVETLAQAYKKTGNYNKAIENYEWLCHYLPNKFGTKLELLRLYVDVGDTLNAQKTGRQILTMPVKLRSKELDRIKNETTNILNRLQ